jgi:hypothetical protein
MVRMGMPVWLAVITGAGLGWYAAWPPADDPAANPAARMPGASPAPVATVSRRPGPSAAAPDPAPHARDPFGVRDWGGAIESGNAMPPAAPTSARAAAAAATPGRPGDLEPARTAVAPQPPGDNAPGIGLEPPPADVPE